MCLRVWSADCRLLWLLLLGCRLPACGPAVYGWPVPLLQAVSCSWPGWCNWLRSWQQEGTAGIRSAGLGMTLGLAVAGAGAHELCSHCKSPRRSDGAEALLVSPHHTPVGHKPVVHEHPEHEYSHGYHSSCMREQNGVQPPSLPARSCCSCSCCCCPHAGVPSLLPQ